MIYLGLALFVSFSTAVLLWAAVVAGARADETWDRYGRKREWDPDD